GIGSAHGCGSPTAWTPAALRGLRDITSASRSCALTQAGVVRCWGFEVADGDALTARSAPGVIISLPPIAQIAPGNGFACARSVGNELWCWGRDSTGQMGDG